MAKKKSPKKSNNAVTKRRAATLRTLQGKPTKRDTKHLRKLAGE